MATSDGGRDEGTGRGGEPVPARRGAALAYLESGKNITGCVAGLAGVALGASGLAGAFWPAAVAGLYAAGALIHPPARPGTPVFAAGPVDELTSLRTDFAALKTYLREVELPQAAGRTVAELSEVLDMLLEPGWVADALNQDPEAVHTLSRAVRRDVPESVDSFVRTRWWTRLQPGGEPPERHLERQLTVLLGEARELVAALQEAETRRQESHTRYLEDRHRAP